jgi:ketosteroid isomerase-like protein
MGDHSQDEKALKEIQHQWADARLKRDSSFATQIEADDFTVVWPDGQIINKQDDVKSYEADGAVFSEFKITDLNVRFYGETAIVVGQGSIKGHTPTKDLSGSYVWTDTFVKQNGGWKAVASQVTSVLKK